MSPLVYLLAATAAASLLLALCLLLVLARVLRRHALQLDRLLLLGKSSSIGEAIAGYERLNRLERIRAADGELVAQRARRTVKAEDGEPVARNAPSGRNWFGFRSPPKPKPEA